jgi:NAD(P)-dependent dehydrogenase (short-subunit alcohol dehydrogenase family)
MQLNNKVTLITGASGGLGTFVAKAFLDAGALVETVAGKVTSGDDARAAAAAVTQKHGRIDALVHLVGAFAGGQPVSDTDDATLENMLNLNLRLAFYMMRAVLPKMREQASGRILAIGSRTAIEPAPMVAAYSASKAALVSLVKTVALENKDRNITANVVLPGTMDTPANRKAMPAADFSTWIQPNQVASLLVYLASDQASQITGAAIPVW